MDISRDIRVVRFLPAYFSAVSHLLGLLSREDSEITEIVWVVATDQSLSSRLLNVVNSPVYGGVRQIGSIDEAVVRLGLVGLRNLVLAVSMNDITGGVRKEEWHHSIIVGHTTDLLCRKFRLSPEIGRVAFVSGLMHDIGKLFLTRRYQLEYRYVFTRLNKGMSLIESEKSVFGFHHGAVGGMLLNEWKVPELIVEAIKLHHEPGQNELATLLYYSDYLVRWKEQPAIPQERISIGSLAQEDILDIYDKAANQARDMEAKIQ